MMYFSYRNWSRRFFLFFFFNDPAPPELSPLPLPDALPILAPQVGDPRCRHGGLEFVGLRDQPVRQLPAVADTLDAHALAVNPRIAPHCRADAVQNVLTLIAVLIAKDRVRKLLPVTGRAAIVHVQRGPAARRIHLVLEIELSRLDRLRAEVCGRGLWR